MSIYIGEIRTLIAYILFQGLELFQAHFHDSTTSPSKCRCINGLHEQFENISHFTIKREYADWNVFGGILLFEILHIIVEEKIK